MEIRREAVNGWTLILIEVALRELNVRIHYRDSTDSIP